MSPASRQRHRVAVVGAGPSGLVAAKSLQEEGLEAVVFEQADGVGGQWYGPSAHSGVWPGMRANTSKTLDAFSDFPPPSRCPCSLASRNSATISGPMRKPSSFID